MRILHVVAGLPPGSGVTEVVARLAASQQALGHTVCIATVASPEADCVVQAQRAGVVIVSHSRSLGYFSLRMLAGLGRLCRSAEVVHVHSNWTFPVWWGCWCALRAARTLVMSPHGCLDPVRLRHSAWKKRLAGGLDRYFFKRASLVHATAPCEAEWIRRALGLPLTAGEPAGQGIRGRPRIEVIPNGVESRAGQAFVSGRRGHGECRTVLYLGRLHPLKGLDLLLEAWAVMRLNSAHIPGEGERGELNAETQRRGGEREKNAQRSRLNSERSTLNAQRATLNVQRSGTFDQQTPSQPRTRTECRWRLVIAGPDEQGTLAALGRQARRLGLRLATCESDVLALSPVDTATEESGPDIDPTIFYAGPLYGEAKHRALQEADLVVLPSRSENFGLVVAEALAVGVPVITTKAAPWAELQGNSASSEVLDSRTSRCGWWVDVGVEPLAAALREAMQLDDATRRDMGARGQRLIRERYGWERVAEQMVDVYRQVSGE